MGKKGIIIGQVGGKSKKAKKEVKPKAKEAAKPKTKKVSQQPVKEQIRVSSPVTEEDSPIQVPYREGECRRCTITAWVKWYPIEACGYPQGANLCDGCLSFLHLMKVVKPFHRVDHHRAEGEDDSSMVGALEAQTMAEEMKPAQVEMEEVT